MTKKKVLITGASKGLGLAISKKLMSDYELILHASKKESFTDVIPGATILCADFSNAEEVAAFCKILKMPG
jgi:3-oxoacyl-[acyl-carrier protein] reductase